MYVINNSIKKCYYKEVIKILTKKDANVDHKNNSGNTALMLGSRNDHIESVKILIDRGANINYLNNNKNILDIVLDNKNLVVIEALINKNVTINKNDMAKYTI